MSSFGPPGMTSPNGDGVHANAHGTSPWQGEVNPWQTSGYRSAVPPAFQNQSEVYPQFSQGGQAVVPSPDYGTPFQHSGPPPEYPPPPSFPAGPQARPSIFQNESQPQRVVHDQPPSWDGSDPDRQVEPYLKLLMGWLSTTRTLKQQRGMTILNYALNDLKLVINELDIEVLTSEESGMRVYAHIRGFIQRIPGEAVAQGIGASLVLAGGEEDSAREYAPVCGTKANVVGGAVKSKV